MLAKARQLDDVVLGTSDSTRGFVMNALYGLHPVLVPLYVVGTAALLVAAVVLLVLGDHRLAAGECAGLAAVYAAMAYASRRLPRTPRP